MDPYPSRIGGSAQAAASPRKTSKVVADFGRTGVIRGLG
ncbi:hypothetical protein ABIE19_000959 [Brevundimonas faecalis]|uniref:Uncharacterized protein n=1 Tax=Brevundimonas faecalis TaxID=947378 RepID=A0ABV2R9F0_9CAUL